MPAKGQEEFLHLPFQQKLEFLYGLPARQKRDLILSAPEAERLVQSFAPETLFYTLKEIGSADAGDLLSMAVPEQIRWLFDLDCWDKDQVNLNRMREWIEAMAEAGRRRMAEGLMALDLELVAMLMRQYVKVHRMADPQDSPDAPSNRFVQFDEHYLIEFIRHDPVQPLLLEFLEEVFECDYNYFTGLMEEIYWGVEAEIEEQAYQFRNSRLADHGFPDYYDAQAVFGYLNPAHFEQLRREYVAPARDSLALEIDLAPEMAPTLSGVGNSLFNAALTAGFAAQGMRELRSEMALVSNQVLVARSVDFGDLEAVRVAIGMTHDYINLALEHLSGGELAAAIDHLRDTHVQLLFRLGVSLTIDLRKRAEAVIERFGFAPGRTGEIPYLDTPYREALSGFLRRQPSFFDGLERAGEISLRDFRAMRDIHLGYAMLDHLDAIPDLFQALLGLDITSVKFRAQVAGHDIRLSQLILTALSREALDGRLLLEPIEPRRLGELHKAIMSKGGRPARLAASFRRIVENAIARRLNQEVRDRTADFINSCLNMLEDELAELDTSRPIDPRFIRSLLLRREPAAA